MAIFVGIQTGAIDAFEGLKTKALSIWDSIGNGIRGTINFIIRGINTLISGMNKISFSIPDWVPGVGGKSFGINIPKIPMLAAGGIVTSPTLAMIGEAGPEAVIPLSRGYGSSGEAKTIVVYLDGRKIYEGMDESLGNRLVGVGGV